MGIVKSCWHIKLKRVIHSSIRINIVFLHLIYHQQFVVKEQKTKLNITIMNVGDKIPEILGIDQDGREIKASDFRGRKIVLYSYPKANTSGCTAEACSLQAHKEELAAAGYEIIGVSKDKQALQKKFAETKGLQFSLIADTETTLLQELGCWGEKVTCGRKTIGILRTTYLVNEEGIIEKIFTPKEIKTKIHAEQILDYIHQ